MTGKQLGPFETEALAPVAAVAAAQPVLLSVKPAENRRLLGPVCQVAGVAMGRYDGQLIGDAIGIAPDLPKTVAGGCGRRRPIAMTSTRPEAITCLACRDWARAEYLLWAGMARAAAELAEAERGSRPRRRPPRLTSAPRSGRTASSQPDSR